MLKKIFQGSNFWRKSSPYITITQPIPFIQRPVLHEGWTPEWRQECIAELKSLLVTKGFLKTIDGAFDQETTLAVKAFQRANSLEVDGFVGQLTWAALLFPVLERTDTIVPETQEQVRELQMNLRKEHLNVEVDGFFGAETERAVKEFQRRCKVRDDGVCGHLTRSLLMGQKTEWIPSSRLFFLSSTLAEQFFIIIAIAAGMNVAAAIHIAAGTHVDPSEGTVTLSVSSLLIVAYGLSCVSQPIFSKLPVDRLAHSDLPLIRFAPYVLTGVFWRSIFGGLFKILL